MTKERFALRTYPGGAVATGKAYTVKLHLDDSTLASGNTGTEGEITYAPNLSPGPHYTTGTDATPTPDAVRVVSSKSSGSGGAYSLAEIPLVLRALGTGVIDNYLNEIACTDPGTAKNIAYATGAALIHGVPAVINTAGTYTATTATDAANPKACYLCLALTGIGQTEEGKVVMTDVCGTAAASPSLPALTQTEVLYQYPLYTFTLGVTGATAANSITNLTDVRSFLPGRNPVVSAIDRRTDPTSVATATSATDTALSVTPTLLNGVTYDLQGRCFLLCKISDAAQTAQVSLYLNGVGNLATYVATNSTSYVGLSNALTLSGVAGTGATISCKVRVAVSGGTMSYTVGLLEVIAVPRT